MPAGNHRVEAVNPTGATVVYDDHRHTYTVRDTGQRLESVTALVQSCFPAFEAEKVAEKCAGRGKYADMTKAEILAAWEAEAERGRSEGTNCHAYAEAILTGQPPPEPISARCERLFAVIDRAVQRLLRFYRFVSAEKIVFSPALGIAGTIDLLMMQGENVTLVLDWKNNKAIRRENRWECGLPPLMHVPACAYEKYRLQLTAYKRILQIEGYYPASQRYKLGLIHLVDALEAEMIPLKPMDAEVDLIFKQRGFS